MVNAGNPNSTRQAGSLCAGLRLQPPGFLLGDSQALSTWKTSISLWCTTTQICGVRPIVLPPAWLVLSQVNPKCTYMHVWGNNSTNTCSGPLCLYGCILDSFLIEKKTLYSSPFQNTAFFFARENGQL